MTGNYGTSQANYIESNQLENSGHPGHSSMDRTQRSHCNQCVHDRGALHSRTSLVKNKLGQRVKV